MEVWLCASTVFPRIFRVRMLGTWENPSSQLSGFAQVLFFPKQFQDAYVGHLEKA